MTPRKASSPKVTKNRASPSKTRAKAQVTVASLTNKSDQTITFLWTCLQAELKKSGGTTIDYKAVGDALNISKVAARDRYYRIRDAFENTQQSGPHDQAQGEEKNSSVEGEEEDDF